jgi:hypothetical protein
VGGDILQPLSEHHEREAETQELVAQVRRGVFVTDMVWAWMVKVIKLFRERRG